MVVDAVIGDLVRGGVELYFLVAVVDGVFDVFGC